MPKWTASELAGQCELGSMIVAGKAAGVRGSPQRVDERIQPVAKAELCRRAEPPGEAGLDVEIVDHDR